MTFSMNRAAAVRVAGAAIGAAAGLRLALPVADVQEVCPAPGEGRTQCVLNEVVLTVGLHVLLLAMAGTLVARLALAAAPLWRARRAGTLLGDVAPMPAGDETLVAATWNRTYETDGRTALLRAPRVHWREPGDRPRRPDDEPRFTRAPLPVGDDGRLAPDELRGWLRAWETRRQA